METKIKPMPGYVFIQPIEDEKKESSIIVPDSADKDVKAEGVVIAAFEGSKLGNGMHVVFNKYSTSTIKVGGIDYLVLKESEIYAVIATK